VSNNLLELRGVTKRFASVRALTRVDLDLQAGEILALLGENGAGKSTLVKVLAGVHRPDEGRILIEGREVRLADPSEAQKHGISIIYQEFSLVPHLSACENIFLGRERRTPWGLLDRSAMRREARALLQRLGVDLDASRLVSQLSIAEQQFVEIAKALGRSARILILDEPTATLTGGEVKRLFAVMRELQRTGVAMIFISHHLDEIFQIAGRVHCLRDGRSVGIRPVSECTPQELVRLIAGRDIIHEFPARPATPPGPVILKVKRLQLEPRLPAVSFGLREGEILGFAGLVGSGRTEVVRALLGADRAHVRDVTCHDRPFDPSTPADSRARGIGLLPEDRRHQGLILPFSVAENVVITNLSALRHPVGGWLSRRRGESAVLRLVNRLSIRASSTRQPASTLSGGNQQKVVIAKWLFADCRILVFDEPTRGIDVGARSEIYGLMRSLTAQGRSIIMVSSELPEVVGMSDRVIVMRQHRIERTIDRAEEITAENIMYYATGGHIA